MKKYIVTGVIIIFLLIVGVVFEREISSKETTTVTSTNKNSLVGATSTGISIQNNVYTDPSGDFSIKTADGWKIRPSHGIEYWSIQEGGTSTLSTQPDSVDIAYNVIISKVPFSAVSQEKPLYSYSSAASGMEQWYESTTNTWKAIRFSQNFDSGSSATKNEPLSLLVNNTCTLVEKYNNHTYYKFIGTDEMTPTTYDYFLITNKGYMINIQTTVGARENYTNVSPEHLPSQEKIATINTILSSLQLNGTTTEVVAGCQ